MKKPKCKLCGSPHWTYEDHTITGDVPGYVKEMVRGHEKRIITFPDSNPPETVTTTASSVELGGMGRYFRMSPQGVPTNLSPQCACGKPRDGRHAKCSACRKRAYRERK